MKRCRRGGHALTSAVKYVNKRTGKHYCRICDAERKRRVRANGRL